MIKLNVMKDGVAVENSIFHCTAHEVEIYAKKKYPDFKASVIDGQKMTVYLSEVSLMDLL